MTLNITWEILTNALKVLVNNSFKKSFYGEKKKKKLNVFDRFFHFP